MHIHRRWSGGSRKRLHRIFLLLGLAAGAVAPAGLSAQQGTIRGVVRSESGVPLVSAQVVVVGTTRGVVTDGSGRFSLSDVPAGPAVLEAQLIGYETTRRELTVGSEVAVVDFVLRHAPLALDGLVVTGQGSAIERRRISTHVDVISSAEIEASPATRLDELLQSRLPSAQIRMTSGQAGTTSLIRTRGLNSVSSNSTPVIYVDGVRVDNLNTAATLSLSISGGRHQGAATSALADLPLDNIERIEHIPGGAATTLYGSDAANGVIQIFTRKGSMGPTRYSAETTIGFDTPTSDFHFFDRTKELLYRTGLTQSYRLGADGGTDRFTWNVSANARASESHRKEGENSSIGFRSGFSAQAGDRGRYDASLSFSQNEMPRFRNGNSGGYNSLWFVEGGRSFAFGFDNDIDALDDGEWNRLLDFVNRAEALQDYSVQVRRFMSSHAVSFDAPGNLTFRSTVGLDYRVSTEQAVTTNAFLIHTQSAPAGTSDRGSIQNYDRKFLGLTFDASAQHRLERGAWSVVSTVGGQVFRNEDEQVAYAAENVRDGSRTLVGAGSTTSSDYTSRVANYGAFAQTNLGLLGRYFLDLGVRVDRNSSFGESVGSQVYPKVGLVYDVTAEPAIRRVLPESLVTQFRLRGNYGVAGNFPRPFANDRTVSFSSLGGEQAATFGQPGNDDLAPERTSTVEVGADLALLSDRVTLGVSWYRALTRDALMNAPSPPSAGEGSQLRNVGEIENRGFEVQTTVVPVSRPGLRVAMNASFNTLKNEVLCTGGTPVFNLGGLSSRTIQAVVEEGFPVGYLRGPSATFNADGTLDEVEYFSYLGKPHPDYFGSFGTTVDIGGSLTLNATGDWQVGAQAHSFDRHFRFNYGLPGDDVPDAAVEEAGGPSRIWLDVFNLFVEDTDFVKLRTVGATYRLPESWAPGRFRDLRIGLQVVNPWSWAASTFDPETDLSGAIGQGAASVGGFNYSTDTHPRSFLFTFGMGF